MGSVFADSLIHGLKMLKDKSYKCVFLKMKLPQEARDRAMYNVYYNRCFPVGLGAGAETMSPVDTGILLCSLPLKVISSCNFMYLLAT